MSALKFSFLVILCASFVLSVPLDKFDKDILSKARDPYHPRTTSRLPSQQQNPVEDNWEDLAELEIQKVLSMPKREQKAKNVILFIGDGLGVTTLTAARWLLQQQQGITMQDAALSFEKFDHVATSKTYSTDNQTPDSASTATALMCGVKCNSGLLGVRQNVGRGECEQAADPQNQVESYFKLANKQGMSTGIVSTARVTHATPAASYAYSPERNWESDKDIEPDTCVGVIDDIAVQLLEQNNYMNVILGGGRQPFLPEEVEDPEYPETYGERTDGKNLITNWIAEMESNSLDASYVWNKTQFNDIDPSVDHLLGLFEVSHMKYEVERKETDDEPSLTEMVDKAIQILQKNELGYVLQVESGRIDHAHHDTAATLALEDTLEFSRAVERAVELTDPEETLIIVTADHSHVFTVAGYVDYDAPILGVNDDVGYAVDGKLYSILGYSNGPGYFYHRYNSTDGDIPEDDEFNPELVVPRMELPSNGDPTLDDHLAVRDAPVPLGSETHAGEDVLIYANGPWAHLFHGLHEQSYIPHVIKYAACIGTDQCHMGSESNASIINPLVVLLCACAMFVHFL